MTEHDIAQRTAGWFLPTPARLAVEAALQAFSTYPGECCITIEKCRNASGQFAVLVSSKKSSASTHQSSIEPGQT